MLRHLDAEKPFSVFLRNSQQQGYIPSHWRLRKSIPSIVLLQCDATFRLKTSFCQNGSDIHKNMPPKPQFRFHNATFTSQDNFRDLTSETIYLIISRIYHTPPCPFNESSKNKTNMQLIHPHIVKYAFSLQQRECHRIFVPKIATYFSTNKFTCYFFC